MTMWKKTVNMGIHKLDHIDIVRVLEYNKTRSFVRYPEWC